MTATQTGIIRADAVDEQEKKLTTIEVFAYSADVRIKPGTFFNLLESVPGGGRPMIVSWTSSNPSIATVDNSGRLTAQRDGTVIITANGTDECEVLRWSISIDEDNDTAADDAVQGTGYGDIAQTGDSLPIISLAASVLAMVGVAGMFLGKRKK